MCRSWDMISLQIPLPPSALYMNELNSPWILQPSVCLCSESADHIFPVFRVAFWKPGLQNEWYGPRDLCVSICLHSGCYCCWQVRWLLCVILYSKSLPFPRILLFYKLWAECYPRISSWWKAYLSSDSHYSSVKTVFYWYEYDCKKIVNSIQWDITVARRPNIFSLCSKTACSGPQLD